MRGTTQERAQAIAADFIAGGMKYAPIGRKYGKIGSRGGRYAYSSETNTGIGIVESRGVQEALKRIAPEEGEETRKYVRKKLYSHAENEKNPHISLKAVEIMAKTEAMLTDRVQMDATTRNMDVYIDYTGADNRIGKP